MLEALTGSGDDGISGKKTGSWDNNDGECRRKPISLVA
jgi:hypothetical protein